VLATIEKHAEPLPKNSKAGDYNVFICMSKRQRTVNLATALRRSTLALFMPRIFADDTHDPLPADDLAVAAHLFDRSPYFHDSLLKPLTCATWRGK
jgi:hypothetical protein